MHTNREPPVYALNAKLDCYTPRGVRSLDYIFQLTTDTRHVGGVDTIVADTLSHPDMNTSNFFDFMQSTEFRLTDPSVRGFFSSLDLWNPSLLFHRRHFARLATSTFWFPPSDHFQLIAVFALRAN